MFASFHNNYKIWRMLFSKILLQIPDDKNTEKRLLNKIFEKK